MVTRQSEVDYAEATSNHLAGGGPELKLSWGTQTLLRLIKKHVLRVKLKSIRSCFPQVTNVEYREAHILIANKAPIHN